MSALWVQSPSQLNSFTEKWLCGKAVSLTVMLHFGAFSISKPVYHLPKLQALSDTSQTWLIFFLMSPQGWFDSFLYYPTACSFTSGLIIAHISRFAPICCIFPVFVLLLSCTQTFFPQSQSLLFLNSFLYVCVCLFFFCLQRNVWITKL